MQKRGATRKPERIECECHARGKLEAYTNFIHDLALALGIVESTDVRERSMNLRSVRKHDVTEQARNILKRFGDYEGDDVH